MDLSLSLACVEHHVWVLPAVPTTAAAPTAPQDAGATYCVGMLAMVVRPKWVGLCPAGEEEKQEVKGTSCMSMFAALVALVFAPSFSTSQVPPKPLLP